MITSDYNLSDNALKFFWMKQDLCLRKCNQRFACCFNDHWDNGLWETDAGEVYEIIKSDKANSHTKQGLEDGSELMCWWFELFISARRICEVPFGSFPVIEVMIVKGAT